DREDRGVNDVDTDGRRSRLVAGRGLLGTILALLLPAAVALAVAAPAAAEPPLDLPGQVHDPEGHLDTGRVETALQELEDEAGLQLFVAYVDSFDGLDGAGWAEETFAESGMGGND